MGYNAASASSSYQGAYEALNGRDPYTGYDGYGAVEVYQEPAVYAEEVPVYGSVQEFEADYGVAGVGKVGSAGHHAGAEIDLRPAAAGPVQPSPIPAAAREQPAVGGARPPRAGGPSGRGGGGVHGGRADAGPGAGACTGPR